MLVYLAKHFVQNPEGAEHYYLRVITNTLIFFEGCYKSAVGELIVLFETTLQEHSIPFTITIPWGKITPRGRTLPNTSHYYCHNVTYPLYFSLPFGAAHLCIYALGA